METERNIWLFFIPLIICACGFILLFLSLQFQWFGDIDRTTTGYCEMPHDGLIRERVNTWSSLAFIIVSLIIGWQMMWNSFRKNVNVLTQSDFMSVFFSSLIICIGLSSMAMHASRTPLSNEFDRRSWLLIGAFMFAYSLQRFSYMDIEYFKDVFLFILVIFELIVRFTDVLPTLEPLSYILSVFHFMIVFVIEILIIYYRQSPIEKKWGIASLMLFSIALIIWNLSKYNGFLCDPEALFQSHVLWHLLAALALYFLFRYYISENNIDQWYLIEQPTYEDYPMKV